MPGSRRRDGGKIFKTAAAARVSPAIASCLPADETAVGIVCLITRGYRGRELQQLGGVAGAPRSSAIPAASSSLSAIWPTGRWRRARGDVPFPRHPPHFWRRAHAAGGAGPGGSSPGPPRPAAGGRSAAFSVHLFDTGDDRGVQLLCPYARREVPAQRRGGHYRDHAQRPCHRRGQLAQPFADQAAERVRHGQRPVGDPADAAPGEGAADLQADEKGCPPTLRGFCAASGGTRKRPAGCVAAGAAHRG